MVGGQAGPPYISHKNNIRRKFVQLTVLEFAMHKDNLNPHFYDSNSLRPLRDVWD